jgi:hypothetical protein
MMFDPCGGSGQARKWASDRTRPDPVSLDVSGLCACSRSRPSADSSELCTQQRLLEGRVGVQKLVFPKCVLKSEVKRREETQWCETLHGFETEKRCKRDRAYTPYSRDTARLLTLTTKPHSVITSHERLSQAVKRSNHSRHTLASPVHMRWSPSINAMCSAASPRAVLPSSARSSADPSCLSAECCLGSRNLPLHVGATTRASACSRPTTALTCRRGAP